jgi:hypothetical protein
MTFVIFVPISLYFGPPHSLFPPFFFLVAVAERSPPPPLREGEGVGLSREQEDSCEETSAARGRIGGWALHVIFTHLTFKNLCCSSDKKCLKTYNFVKNIFLNVKLYYTSHGLITSLITLVCNFTIVRINT